MAWSAADYLRFEDERTRPVRDLLAGVADRIVHKAIDLGCGPGNSTEVLAARFPGAVVSGLDSAPDMIEAAQARLPKAAFTLGDIAAWAPAETYDIVLSNAALHWVGDHAALLPRLLGRVAPGGALAVQLPDNLDEPAQTLMLEVARDGPWSAKLAGAAQARTEIASAGWYYNLLKPHCRSVALWRTTYYQVLPGGAAGIVAWFHSTGLRPFLDPLDAAEQAAYLERYEAAIGACGCYPPLVDGSVLLAMPRLFVVANR